GEIKKLEIELWNLKVIENNVPAYTKRFQELTLICTKFVADETEKIDNVETRARSLHVPSVILVRTVASIFVGGVSLKGLIDHSLNGFWSHVVWVGVVRKSTRSLSCHRCHDLPKSKDSKRECSATVAVSGVSGAKTHVRTPAPGESEAQNGLPDSILSKRLNCLTSQSLGMITLPHCPATSEKDLEDHSCRGSPPSNTKACNSAADFIRIELSNLSKAINLDNELRSIKIGKMTVNEYCTKIKSMADRLKNLCCVVSEKNLVIYTVDGLDSRFATLVKIMLKKEKARKVYNWETATYGKIWYDEDVHDLKSVETKFSAIVFNDAFTSEVTPSYEAHAIVYNDVLTSKSDFSTKPTLCPQHIDKFNLKDETSLYECDEKEQYVLYFNDLFPFNVIYPDDLKSDMENDNDKIHIEQHSGDMSVIPLPNASKELGSVTSPINETFATMNRASAATWVPPSVAHRCATVTLADQAAVTSTD
nr:hybrid signal transduction histidine kinase M [Tanacetum cinerariifolium]